ncbi:MAG: DUF4321 domain-containing protein [Ruminococcaceae bacterium]|nr:DUF4321 domain-containing protein [Oscillospiraceae bacterium]
MKTKGAVNVLILIFLLLSALVISALVGTLTSDIEWLKWLTWGESVGLDTITLDLSVISLSFSFRMQVNALQILCIGLALFINKKFF